jgi:hypothetical protein
MQVGLAFEFRLLIKRLQALFAGHLVVFCISGWQNRVSRPDRFHRNFFKTPYPKLQA